MVCTAYQLGSCGNGSKAGTREEDLTRVGIPSTASPPQSHSWIGNELVSAPDQSGNKSLLPGRQIGKEPNSEMVMLTRLVCSQSASEILQPSSSRTFLPLPARFSIDMTLHGALRCNSGTIVGRQLRNDKLSRISHWRFSTAPGKINSGKIPGRRFFLAFEFRPSYLPRVRSGQRSCGSKGKMKVGK